MELSLPLPLYKRLATTPRLTIQGRGTATALGAQKTEKVKASDSFSASPVEHLLTCYCTQRSAPLPRQNWKHSCGLIT